MAVQGYSHEEHLRALGITVCCALFILCMCRRCLMHLHGFLVAKGNCCVHQMLLFVC